MSTYGGPRPEHGYDNLETAPIPPVSPIPPTSPAPPVRVDAPRSPRQPRGARPWPFQEPWWIGVVILGAFIAFGLFWFIANFQGDRYTQAGSGSPEALTGAVFAEILVLGLMVTTGVAYRLGYRIPQVVATGGLTAVVALFFGLLPNLTAGSSWLTTLLGVVIVLVYDILLAVGLGALTRYLPLPSDPKE